MDFLNAICGVAGSNKTNITVLFRLPPSLPNNPNTFIPRDFAAIAARTTFSEFPLVESTTSRSPGCPSANSGRAKISANPKSFAVQVMCPASLSAIAGSGFLSLRNLPVHSSAKWVASHKLPPFPQVKTLPSRSNTSRISSAVAAMVAIFSGFRINRSSISRASNNASRMFFNLSLRSNDACFMFDVPSIYPPAPLLQAACFR